VLFTYLVFQVGSDDPLHRSGKVLAERCTVRRSDLLPLGRAPGSQEEAQETRLAARVVDISTHLLKGCSIRSGGGHGRRALKCVGAENSTAYAGRWYIYIYINRRRCPWTVPFGRNI
jgi:hypothetical protein